MLKVLLLLSFFLPFSGYAQSTVTYDFDWPLGDVWYRDFAFVQERMPDVELSASDYYILGAQSSCGALDGAGFINPPSERNILLNSRAATMTFKDPAIQVSFYSAGWGSLGPRVIRAYNEFGSVIEEKMDVEVPVVDCGPGKDPSVDYSSMVFIKFGPYANGDKIKKIEFVDAGEIDSLKISYVDKSVCNVRDKGVLLSIFLKKLTHGQRNNMIIRQKIFLL